MVTFTLNGAPFTSDMAEDATLLEALRGPAGLSGPKFGCGAEACGACMVLLDGKAVPSCVMTAGMAEGRAVTSVEGLGSEAHPHPLQTAFLAEQAGQCGFCLPGILISAAALLAAEPDPDRDRIRQALEPNLCRCGSHNRILRAVQRAASAMRGAAPASAA